MRKFEKVNGRLRPEDADRIVEETIAEQRLEGIHLTDEEIGKLRDYVHGRITGGEYDAWVLEHAGATV